MKAIIARIAPVALAASLAACVTESESTPEERVQERAEAQAPAPMILTFSHELRSKLFIAGVPTCGPDPAPWWAGPGHWAAWRAFCAVTAATYVENPPNGLAPVPLDARVLGVGQATWRCQAGNAAPIAFANAVAGISAGGMEGPFLGVAWPVGVRNSLLVNGTWGMVSSGRPNPAVEPTFQAIWPRWPPDIWNKIATSITCGVDAQGRPTATSNFNLTATWFPSHRVWRRSPIANPVAGVLFNLPQRALSDLWALPPIPAP
jgi:hypothetical protein